MTGDASGAHRPDTTAGAARADAVDVDDVTSDDAAPDDPRVGAQGDGSSDATYGGADRGGAYAGDDRDRACVGGVRGGRIGRSGTSEAGSDEGDGGGVGFDEDLDEVDLGSMDDDEIADMFAARRRRGRRRFDGLRLILGEWMGGASGRPARPSMIVHVPLDIAARHAAGRIDTGLAGSLPTISAALTELIARDADVRAVIFDGARPLTTSKKLRAADIPAATRVAVMARDRTDRMPGSPLPIDHIHHTHERARGGDHHPDRLVGLSGRSHRLIHRHGWNTSIDPDTGVFTIRREGRTFRSLPAGTALEPGPPRPPPGPRRPQPRTSRPPPAAADADLPS